MGNDGALSGDGRSSPGPTRPWLLSVPNFTIRKRQSKNTTNRKVDINYNNEARLLHESQNDPEWHTLRIPLERRKPLRLPVLSWSSVDKSLDKKLAVEIEPLVETGMPKHPQDSANFRTVCQLIPLELRKRKRSDVLSPASLNSTGRELIEMSDPKKVKKIESTPLLLSLLGEQSTTPVEAEQSASEMKEMTDDERPSTQTWNGHVQKASFARPESPPMRILSVRSLADDSSYFYDPLDERIPVDVPAKNGDDQPPLYIFNPVKRYTDLVGDKAQNDVHPIVNSETSKETSSDTRLPINASSGSAKTIARSKTATQSSRRSDLNVSPNDTGTTIIRNSSNDGSCNRNGPEKVTQEINAETGTEASIPITRDTPPSVGKNTASPSKAPRTKRSPNKSKRNGSVGISELPESNDTAVAPQIEERLLYTCTSDDVRFVIGFDPNSSPFEDSDEDDDDGRKDRLPENAIEPNFTSCVLKELDVNGGELTEDAQKLAELDHSYSKPHDEEAPSTSSHGGSTIPDDCIPPQSAATTGECLSIRGPTRLVMRLPRIADPNQGIELADCGLPGRRHRKNSSSSSTDTSVGVSTKASHFSTSVSRLQSQDEPVTKSKVIKSKVILKKMQRIAQKERSGCPANIIALEKQIFLRKLGNHFRKHDFSTEPLNRSILNAIAEWLSPLSNGKLPPLSLRNTLIDLIKEFTLTTPAQVFQTSSIEGVLILLMNHPQESFRNKRLEWSIVNKWRDD